MMEKMMENQKYSYDIKEENAVDTTAKGLKIAIVILLVVLCAVGFLYWNSVQQAKEDQEALRVEMDTLQSHLGTLQVDLEDIQFDNDTLNQYLAEERYKADSLMRKLKQERNYGYATVKKYQRELGTLRSTMKGFVHQIDSLNQLTKKLTAEGIAYRKEISTYKVRTEAAEEVASELNYKIQKGSIIRARNIVLSALNRREKPVTKARQADKLITSFILAANELSEPGLRTVHACIVSPNGIILSESPNNTFVFEDQQIPYTSSREIDYQNEDLAVSLYFDSGELNAGTYTVMLYMDGQLIGTISDGLR